MQFWLQPFLHHTKGSPSLLALSISFWLQPFCARSTRQAIAFFAGPGFKAMAAEQPSKKLRRLAVLQDTQDEAPHPAGTEDRQEEVWEEDPVLDNMEELVECLEEQNRLLRLQIEEMEEQVAQERARGDELQLKIVHNRALLEFLRSTVGELGHSIANFGAVHILMQQEPTE